MYLERDDIEIRRKRIHLRGDLDRFFFFYSLRSTADLTSRSLPSLFFFFFFRKAAYKKEHEPLTTAGRRWRSSIRNLTVVHVSSTYTFEHFETSVRSRRLARATFIYSIFKWSTAAFTCSERHGHWRSSLNIPRRMSLNIPSLEKGFWG